MKPKEHGAYAILAIPAVTALIVGGPTTVGFLIAVASFAGFFAHEPLLVAWGHRGGRAKEVAPTASTRLVVLLGISIASGSAAMILCQWPIRAALIGCLSLAVVSFAVAFGGQHRTLGGQLLGVISLSAPSVPISVAGLVELPMALMIWVAWMLGFASTTVAVRGVIAGQKRQSRHVLWIILVIVSALCVIGFLRYSAVFVPVLPMILPSWYLMLQPPPAKFLKRVGWTLVSGTVATGILIAAQV